MFFDKTVQSFAEPNLMIFLPANTLKSFISFGLILFYFIFFINLITDDRSSWSLVYIPSLLLVIYLIKNRIFYIHPIVFAVGISSALLITLNEYIFHIHQTDLAINKHENKYIHQFLYVIPFIFLGTLFKFSNFTAKKFEKIILISIIFSLIFNIYLNLKHDFYRDLLIPEFKSIILYDYCIITLSLIGLIFSFKLKSKLSFLFIGLCLFNISMITLHGSRGAWIGIPVTLFMIAFYFYKTHLKHTIFMILMSLTLTIGMIFMPNSPIMDRIDHLQSDASLMEKNNYNTSVGTRFALWRFALEKFQQAPYAGNGFVNFKNQICVPESKNIVPNCQPHAHNIIFQELAAHGLLGFLNILILSSLPLYYFIKNLMKSPNRHTRLLAFSGLITMLYLTICSMSDYLFFFPFPTMFTFLIILSLLNIIYVENLNNENKNDASFC